MKTSSDIHARLLAILRAHPEGIDIGAIRRALDLPADAQQHLDRRIRDLDRRYVIDRVRSGRSLLYALRSEKVEPLDESKVDKTTRARILHVAGYRCQACGRSPEEDRVKLHIDHRIPRDWGGSGEDDNLWALCSTCNEGKKDFFASIQDPRVREAMLDSRVHVRIGELLKAFAGQPVPKTYIALVASTHDDFEKRMRELRDLGWSYHVTKRKEFGRIQTSFVLDHWEPWPDDPAAAIRDAERARGSRRSGSSTSGTRTMTT